MFSLRFSGAADSVSPSFTPSKKRREKFSDRRRARTMNQILKPAARDRTRFCGDPLPDIAIDIRDRPTGRTNYDIEYDDGDPATIVPAGRRNPGGGSRARRAVGSDRAASFRAPLASLDCPATVEYDDGNPATIAAAAD
jgi:hypothetical protein